MNSLYPIIVVINKQGKYMVIRKYPGELKLCAVDRQQGNEPPLKIERRVDEGKKQMAFVFKRGRRSYLPKVEDDKLKIEEVKADNYDSLADKFWFEKEDVGNNEHYRLRSVVESRLYLTANPLIFTLSETKYSMVTDGSPRENQHQVFCHPTSNFTA